MNLALSETGGDAIGIQKRKSHESCIVRGAHAPPHNGCYPTMRFVSDSTYAVFYSKPLKVLKYTISPFSMVLITA